MRRMSGIWPPSKPMRMELPERAVWPLPPRPLVLPWPLDSPWPSRLRRCLAPGRGLKSCKRIKRSGRGGRRFDRFGRRPYFEAATAVDVVPQAELLQRAQRGFHDVGRVLRAERLGQYILEPDGFEDRPDGFAGDHSRSGRGRTQQNMRAAKAPGDLVRNGAVAEGDAHHGRAGDFAAFANRIGHFAGLAQSDADPPMLVAHHHQRAETEAASALDNFGRAIDEHDLLRQFGRGHAVRRDKFGPAFGGSPTATRTTAHAPRARSRAATFAG